MGSNGRRSQVRPGPVNRGVFQTTTPRETPRASPGKKEPCLALRLEGDGPRRPPDRKGSPKETSPQRLRLNPDAQAGPLVYLKHQVDLLQEPLRLLPELRPRGGTPTLRQAGNPAGLKRVQAERPPPARLSAGGREDARAWLRASGTAIRGDPVCRQEMPGFHSTLVQVSCPTKACKGPPPGGRSSLDARPAYRPCGAQREKARPPLADPAGAKERSSQTREPARRGRPGCRGPIGGASTPTKTPCPFSRVLVCLLPVCWTSVLAKLEGGEIMNKRIHGTAGWPAFLAAAGLVVLLQGCSLFTPPAPPPPTVVGNSLSVVSWGPDRLDLFALGTDQALWHCARDGSAWSPWQSLGGTLTSAPSVASWGPNRLDVFALGPTHNLLHIAWNGSEWSAWEDHDGVYMLAPEAVSWGPYRLDVFVVKADGSLQHFGWNGSWQTDNLGGILTSRPSAAAWGPDRLDVFALGSDHSLFHIAWDGSAWSLWEPLGGEFAFSPEAVAWGPSRLDVFVVRDDSRALEHFGWNGSWQVDELGGILLSAPSAAAWGPNRLDVFAVGTDHSLFHIAWNGALWSSWNSRGGSFVPSPESVARQVNRLDVFAVSADGLVSQISWDGATWSPTWPLEPLALPGD